MANVYLEPVWLSPSERDGWHRYRAKTLGRPKKRPAPQDPDAIGGKGDPCPRCVGPVQTRNRIITYQGRSWWRCCGAAAG